MLMTLAGHANPAFRFAAAHGKLKQIKELQKQTHINEKGANGKNALLLAAEQGHADVIEYLLSLKKIDTKVRDKAGNTIFHLAARGGHSNLIPMLAKKIGTKLVNTRNTYNETPLHLALYNPDMATAAALISEGDDPNITFKKEYSALQVAVQMNSYKITINLINAGAKIRDADITVAEKFAGQALIDTLKDKQNETPQQPNAQKKAAPA